MKKSIMIIAWSFMIALVYGQKPNNINVNYSGQGTGDKLYIDRFYLNHTVYIKAFILNNIYPDVTVSEVNYITDVILESLKKDNSIQFIINTGNSEPYRLAFKILEKDGNKGLIILTNYNPKTNKFEREIQNHFYATSGDIKDNKMIDGYYALPLDKESQFIKKKDYISLIQLYTFDGLADDEKKMRGLFEKAEAQKNGDINMVYWLKSYYFLYKRDYKESQKYLTELKNNIAKLSSDKQLAWKSSVDILEFEIDLLK